MADNSSLTFLQFFLPVFFFLSPSHLLSLLLPAEIPTVPIYYLAKPQPRERAWRNQRGKKTLLSLTLVRLCEET
uniref:Conotoxin Superfamily SF1 n=1 Tax=Conus episcopatus TaxID=88764 RepID=A0A0K2S7X5_CONEP|nr:Conotoxin Superfamily SF1 [Conus episcopatus]